MLRTISVIFGELRFGWVEDANAAVPTDKRVQHIKDGAEDVGLLPIYFQFGQYMLISSSRPGTLAANLQGSGTSRSTRYGVRSTR